MDHVHGSPASEEEFTKKNLRRFRRLHGGRVQIREFHRSEEARNGADWEWWFHSGKRGFGMRVQAKRMKPGGSYQLKYTVRGRLQSELLVEDAQASGCLPAYVFYNHRNWTPYSPGHAVFDCPHGSGEQAHLGCTIVSAHTVRAAILDPKLGPRYARQQSMPWHTILCDDSDQSPGDLEGAYAVVNFMHRAGLVHFAWAENSVAFRAERPERDTVKGDKWSSASGKHVDLPPVTHPVAHADSLVLPSGISRRLALRDANDQPLPELPERVVAMIAGRDVQSPDPRLKMSVLIDLAT
ncbi:MULTISPECIES: DUF6615 family protein [Streptomyces]|uniref:Uncharacterized protein n=1 Tax=Streptomyces lycii TaxID=2654337 RepID=A0ABQ7FFK4_9ACTN|nr:MULTISPECIES: DUF6615 family protein [Streptomyces]KAF4406753.1 hypothetical protein GCU69_23150 [Streptomyces lycii]